ncbi:unnamed protein product [Cochlearia groenlandica]
MDNINEETKIPVSISYNKKDSSVSSFISHLEPALDREIRVNNGLEHIILVVFSKHYASSTSCLDNLLRFLELSTRRDINNNNVVVVPVFYGVTRLAVKQQSGLFSKVFRKHERSCFKDKVATWRRALAETAVLQGHDYNDELSEESKFLEEIVQGVFERLYPTSEIGINKQQSEIYNLLCKQPWGVRTLGISGESGIGKTTLTRAIHRQVLSSCYDESFVFEDFHSSYNSQERLEPLHDKFLCTTPMEDFDLNNQDLKPPRHRQKRVSLAIDDVRNAKDVESFLGGFDRFASGSLIIITSRDKRVLEECHVNEIYELQGLSDEDALKLFTRYVFEDIVDIEPKLLDLATRMVQCRGGNPTTIISYAKELKGKTTTEIEAALLEICHDHSCIDTKENTPLCYNTCRDHNKNDIMMDTRDTKTVSIKEPKWRGGQIVVSDLVVQSFLQGFSGHFHKLWELSGGYYKSFSRLKRINIGHIDTLIEVEELSEAHGLEQIVLRDCTNLESIPITDKLKHLQVLDLSGCKGIKRFPRIVLTIKELNLEGTGLREIRSQTTNYSQLVKQE